LRTNTTTWARLLGYATGLVNQELLLQNEYLAAEIRILKARLQPGWRLSDGERATLAGIGRRLGRKGLQQIASIAKPVLLQIASAEHVQPLLFLSDLAVYRCSSRICHRPMCLKTS